jgi:hypothetical protein
MALQSALVDVGQQVYGNARGRAGNRRSEALVPVDHGTTTIRISQVTAHPQHAGMPRHCQKHEIELGGAS